MVTVKDSIEVVALPTDLPESFVLDQSLLKEIGQTLSLADLKFDADKIELVLAEGEVPSEVVLLSVQEKREKKRLSEVAPSEGAEPERVGEKPVEEVSAAEEK